MFIHADGGKSINLAHVVSVREAFAPGKGCSTLFTMIDGSTERSHISADHIERAAMPLIPAEPGYFALSFDVDGSGEELIDREPVIAWRVHYDADGLEAVTPFGSAGAILYPDGQVTEIGLGKWDSIDQWIEEKRKERARQAQDRPAA